MHDTLTIKGVPPYDGDYELDIVELIDSLTNREMHRIKVMSGVRAGELIDALDSADTDITVALTVVFLTRKGKTVNEDLFWDANAGSSISLKLYQREEVPPTEAATQPPETNGGGSGPALSESIQENDPSPTGPHALPKSSIYDRATSVI